MLAELSMTSFSTFLNQCLLVVTCHENPHNSLNNRDRQIQIISHKTPSYAAAWYITFQVPRPRMGMFFPLLRASFGTCAAMTENPRAVGDCGARWWPSRLGGCGSCCFVSFYHALYACRDYIFCLYLRNEFLKSILLFQSEDTTAFFTAQGKCTSRVTFAGIHEDLNLQPRFILLYSVHSRLHH